MRKFYKNVVCLTMTLLTFGAGSLSFGQISYTQDWEAGGMNSWVDGGTNGGFGTSTTAPCAGTSVRANNYYGGTSTLRSPLLTGTNGGDLTVSFNYKVVTYGDETIGASSADFGTVRVQWATATGGPWTTVYTIDNTTHVVSASCVTASTTFSGLPSTGDVYVRFSATSGNTDADNYVYFDNVAISQGAAPTCLVPSGLATTSLTTSSVGISWTAGGTETDWNIEWGAPGFTPGTGAEIGSDAVSTTPSTTINSLTSSTTYHIYVQADCGGGDESSWVGPLVIYTGYCTPSSTNNATYINNFVTTGGLTNISNLASGYTTGGYLNATSQSVALSEGDAFDFNMAIVGGTVGAAIWVDWNNDLTFQTTERVFNTTGYGNGPFTGTITVPGGTPDGNYRMRALIHFNASNPADACATNTRLESEDYVISVVTIVVPPAPIQEAGIPTCTDGTDLTVTGTPGANETWYWQTSATGTSTANNATTPWTVYENGTYYVRTHNSVYNAWSDASSVVVSNVPTAPAPPTPLAAQNPACTPGTEISVSAAPAGITYYWQGTSNSSSSTTDNASAPYTVATTGTYYVKAYEAATGCWSDPEGILVTVDSQIPANAIASPAEFNYCNDITSAMISAVTAINELDTLTTTLAGGNGCTGGNMFNVTTQSDAVIITGLDVVPNSTGTQNLSVYTKTGVYAGSETTAASWTLLGTYSFTGTMASPIFVDITDFTIPAGTTYAIYAQYDAQYTDVSVGTTYSDANITITAGAGLCGAFTSVNAGRAFNGRVHYAIPVPATATWYDAATGGNVIGTANPLEAVGTSVLPTVSEGTYEFYVASTLGGCQSADRTLVTVNINALNVELTAIDASCNNGNDGSFAVTDTLCGVAPFTYAVDGGAFGPIPSNLAIGSHTVVVRDANADESATYTIVVGSPAGPSGVTVTTLSNDQVVIVWDSNGSETEWNIEWGAPGFTPGTGTEIGADTALDTTFTITGLDGSTEYDIYVSANCGAGTTTGDWDLVNVTTECDPIAALNFCENFEDVALLNCWRVIDGNEDGEQWGIYTGYANSGTQAAGMYTDFLGGDNDDYLVLPRMTLTGNEVMSFAYRAMDSDEPNDFRIVLSTTDANAASFTNVLYEDTVSNETYQTASVDLSAYTGDVYIAFHIPDDGLDGWYLFIDDVCIDICTPTPGTDGTVNVCRTQGTVDLNSVITSDYTHGTWSYAPLSGVVNGSTMNVSALADGTYEVTYVVTTACTSDTTVATINLVSPASAGNNGLLSVCKNQMIDLFGALSGNVDFGGTWYAPNGTPMTSSYFQTGTLAGQSIYKYIVSNGACGADTAEVTVDISNCDFLGLEDVTLLDNVSIAPNPNHGQFQIIGIPGADFTFEVLDLNGRVVRSSAKITSSITNVNLTDVENGVYMVRIVGNDSEKMMRVIKQ